MKNFDIFKLKSDDRKLIAATSYVSPLGNILKISRELSAVGYKGDVLFDLLLSNGFTPNRFLMISFDGKKLLLNTRKTVDNISNDTLVELAEIFYEHPDWVDQSSLPDVQKNILRNKLYAG